MPSAKTSNSLNRVNIYFAPWRVDLRPMQCPPLSEMCEAGGGNIACISKVHALKVCGLSQGERHGVRPCDGSVVFLHWTRQAWTERKLWSVLRKRIRTT